MRTRSFALLPCLPAGPGFRAGRGRIINVVFGGTRTPSGATTRQNAHSRALRIQRRVYRQEQVTPPLGALWIAGGITAGMDSVAGARFSPPNSCNPMAIHRMTKAGRAVSDSPILDRGIDLVAETNERQPKTEYSLAAPHCQTRRSLPGEC
jgi:hypothetical protein